MESGQNAGNKREGFASVMNYGEIKYCDIANGTGVRTSVFVSGCRNHCEDCFNSDTWSFDFGNPFTKEVENEVIESLKLPYICGLTVLGGEPFEVENQSGVLGLMKRVRNECPTKSIWVYSGFTYEELLSGSRAATDTAKEILKTADILVDGRYDKNLRNISLKFRGSENQRIIDLKATISNGKVILAEKYM